MRSGSDKTPLGCDWTLICRKKHLSWRKGATAKRIVVLKGTASAFSQGLTVGANVVVMYTHSQEVTPRIA